MDYNAQREKFSRYIEIAIKAQVEDLAKDWKPEKLGDLYQSLCDYMEIETEPATEINEASLCRNGEKKKASNSKRVPWGFKTEVFDAILDMFQSQTGTQKKEFDIKASDFGLDRDTFVSKIAKAINNCDRKTKRFPDLNIKYISTKDGARFLLSRKKGR